MRFLHALLVAGGVLVCGFAASCKSSSKDSLEVQAGAVERVDFDGPTSYVFCGNAYVGAVPDAEQVELAARRGVELVLSIGPVGSGLSDEALDRARWLELQVERVHFDGSVPTDLDVQRALDWMTAERRGRVLMHSTQGGWAAGMLAIARVECMGVEPTEALAEARHAGLDPGPQETFIIERLGLGTFER